MTTNLLFVFRRRWPILVGLPLVVVFAVLVLSPTAKAAKPKYTASVIIAGSPGEVGTVTLEQAAVDVKQPDVAGIAAQKLDVTPENLEEFAQDITPKVDAEALSIRLTAESTDKDFVRPYATAFAEAFLEVNEVELEAVFQTNLKAALDQQAQASAELTAFVTANALKLGANPPDVVATQQRQVLQDQQLSAQQRVAEVRSGQVTSPYRISGQTKVRPSAAVKLSLPASRPLRVVMALILALLGATALVAIVERLNPRIDSPKDAEDIVGAPVLAMVPIMRGKRRNVLDRVNLEQFSGPFAESFRAMRSHLDFRSGVEGLDRPPCVMIVSSAPAEGKTTSTAFLALSYAEAGREVVVVGADFRRPSVHRLFGLKSKPGLSSRLLDPRGPADPGDAVRSIVKRDPMTGVRVIPSGPATDRVTGLIGDMSAVISAAVDSDCTVVVDTAPIMVANDAIDFLPLVDWVVVVVRVGKTTERSLRQTITSLELNDAKIAGCVMVGSLESSDAKRYYYSYYKVDDEVPGGGLPPSANGVDVPGDDADLDRAYLDRTGPDRADPDRADLDRTGPDRADPKRADPDGAEAGDVDAGDAEVDTESATPSNEPLEPAPGQPGDRTLS